MHYKTLLRNLNVMAIFCSSQALAGWSSGGGTLFRDELNPWFVKNTKVVNFCVEIDEANFGLSREAATAQLQDAIMLWQKQIPLRQNTVGVATQTFIVGECSEATDIKVQFGMLDSKQEKYLQTPQKFVAATVRTRYDTVQLKGAGFIYVSPQSGPLRMATGRGGVEAPWSMANGNLLGFVLAHELGHVFGYGSGGGDLWLMDETFPESAVSNYATLLAPFKASQLIDLFQSEQISRMECGDKENVSEALRHFFAAPANAKCIEVKVWPSLNAFEVRYLSTDAEDVGRHVLGGGQLTACKQIYRMNPSIYLPVEQQVFDFDSSIIRYALPSPIELVCPAVYSGKDSSVLRPLLFHTYPSDFELSGPLDGRMLKDVLEDLNSAKKSQKLLAEPYRSSTKTVNILQNRLRVLRQKHL